MIEGKLSCSFFLIISILALVDTILNTPICSAKSPTCHRLVPYGTPIHAHQGWRGSLTYWSDVNEPFGIQRTRHGTLTPATVQIGLSFYWRAISLNSSTCFKENITSNVQL